MNTRQNWAVLGCAGVGLLLLTATTGRASILFGQVDTFAGGSNDNWVNGARPATVISTGGPGGANSPYMQISSVGGGGPFSRMAIYNNSESQDSQWTGNYTAAGVTEIQMMLKDLTSPAPTPPLDIRVTLESDPAVNAASPGWSSTNGFSLPNDGNWHLATFLLDSQDLTAVNSPLSLPDVLTSVGELRLIESTVPNLKGDSISASIGVANITATAAGSVPEPCSLALLGLAASGFLRRRHGS